MEAERDERLKLRSKTRHLHIVSQLENLEIGQNLYGRRSLSSTILNSEHREYRIDQRLMTELNSVPLKMKNRRVVVKSAEKIISYDQPENDFDLSYAQDPLRILQVFLVDCELNNKTETIALVLRQRNFYVYNLNSSENPIKKFILPYVIRNCHSKKMNWNRKNESLCIKIAGNEDTCFLLFDILSLEFVTSFVVKHNAIKFFFGELSKLKLKQDILHIRWASTLILYSFPEYWEKFGNSRRISDIAEDLDLESELPIVFEITEFSQSLFYIEESHQIMHVSPNLPFIFVFPRLSYPSFSGNFSHHPFVIMDLKNPETLVDFNQKCPFPRNGRGVNFSDFEMNTKKRSSFIFADDSNSTFLAFEKCDLVKYYVNNNETIREVWRTTIFPNVENRNFYLRELYERAKEERSGLENYYRDKTLSKHMKIHNAYQSKDGENIIVYLSIEDGLLLPNGYFAMMAFTRNDIMRFAYIIDDKNGEILRIIPLTKKNETDGNQPWEFELEEDMLTLPKKASSPISVLEIWQLMEPQQYIIDDN
ncbi:unnamed protein product [Caenorhabditis angaria]|uniref:Uncharacterized protein n=1 Tax=Caenorhabditis angaria TaxID=860376 RepID=A0A9P1MYQ9_9PELO|nr:unnamed protein product [Caenorhabditis angaria]